MLAGIVVSGSVTVNEVSEKDSVPVCCADPVCVASPVDRDAGMSEAETTVSVKLGIWRLTSDGAFEGAFEGARASVEGPSTVKGSPHVEDWAVVREMRERRAVLLR